MPYKNPAVNRAYHRTYYQQKRKPQLETGLDRKRAITISLANSMIGRLQRIVNEGIATGAFPWRNMSQAIAALLTRGMESMKNDPEMESMLVYLRGIGQLEGMAQHRIEAKAAFNRAKTEIAEMLEIGAEPHAVRYFHALRSTFAAMDTHVWQQWLLKQLDQTFPKLAIQKPKPISLDEHEEEEPPYEKTEHKPRRKRR